MKMVLVLLMTLLPFLQAQTLCPILQEGFQPCTDTCVEEMNEVVEISGHQPDYPGFLAEKYEEYLQSESIYCVYIFCGLIQKSYGHSFAASICSY